MATGKKVDEPFYAARFLFHVGINRKERLSTKNILVQFVSTVELDAKEFGQCTANICGGHQPPTTSWESRWQQLGIRMRSEESGREFAVLARPTMGEDWVWINLRAFEETPAIYGKINIVDRIPFLSPVIIDGIILQGPK
jgi:hypothetical protein